MKSSKIQQPIENIIKSRIYGHGRGWCFTPNDFIGLGSSDAILKALQRITAAGVIRRLAQGIYDYPQQHPKLGVVFSGADSIADAVARKHNIRIQPSGAHAANALGLSEQVPARVTFLTDGQTKKIKVGNTTIIFKNTTPKNMSLAGTEMGLIIQALKYIGQNAITPNMERSIKTRIVKMDEKALQQAQKMVPAWMNKLFRRMRGAL